MTTVDHDRPIVILGAGGFAREVLDVIEAQAAVGGRSTGAGFIVDARYFRPGAVINGLPVLGDFSWLASHSRDVLVICGVGDPAVRRRMIGQAVNYSARFATLVHPRATLTPRVTIGEGTVVTAGVVITNNIDVGSHVHLNLNVTVGHDAVLADYATLAPGVHVSGNVTLGEGAYLGTGAVVLERISIGAWAILGAGAVAANDIPPNTTAVGVPARVVKQREPGWHLSESH